MTAVSFMYADSCYFVSMRGSCYFMYAESRYFMSMLTAVQEQRSRLFLCLFYLCRKPYVELKLPSVIPGSSKRLSFAPVCSYRVVDFLNSLN